MPLSLPPEDLPNGSLLAGLGVSDIRKTWGTFFYFATDLTQWDVGNTEFGGVLVRLEAQQFPPGSRPVEGPYDPRYDDYRRISIPMELELTQDGRALKIRFCRDRSRRCPRGTGATGSTSASAPACLSICGASAVSTCWKTYPEIRLYLEPISMDPRNPPTPISSPPEFSGGTGPAHRALQDHGLDPRDLGFERGEDRREGLPGGPVSQHGRARGRD